MMIILHVVTPSASTAPSCYYRFESAATALVDTAGNRNITGGNIAAAPTIQQADKTSVGGFAVFGYGLEGRSSGWPASQSLEWKAKACGGGAIPVGAPGLTIEFLLHPTPQCFLRGGLTQLLGSTTGAVSFGIDYLSLRWTAAVAGDANASESTLSVPLQGEGTLAADYLWGTTAPAGRWHHVALVRDAASGNQSIWIDGERQPEMHREGRAAHERSGSGTAASGLADIGDLIIDVDNQIVLCAGLDELAVWPSAPPGSTFEYGLCSSRVSW